MKNLLHIFIILSLVFCVLPKEAKAQTASVNNNLSIDLLIKNAVSGAEIAIIPAKGNTNINGFTGNFTAIAVQTGIGYAYATGGAFAGEIKSDGTIDYDPLNEPFLDGAGSSTLDVVGFSINMMNHTSMELTPWRASPFLIVPNQTQALSLLPGSLEAYPVQTGIGFLYTAGGTFTWEIKNDGNIGYDPSNESFLDGAGSSTLDVVGFSINMMNHTSMELTPWRAGPFLIVPNQTQALSLLPGSLEAYPVQTGIGFLYTSGGTFTWKIKNDGNIDYEPSNESFLNGAGSSTLEVVGFSIAMINHTSMELTPWRASPFLIVPNQTQALILLPGSLEAYPVQTGIGFLYTSGGTFTWEIKNDGNIGYDPSNEAFLNGAGSSTLEVVGFSIAMINHTSMELTPWRASPFLMAPCQTIDLSLLPGSLEAYPVQTGIGFVYTSGGTFTWEIKNDGNIGYELSNEPFLNGLNTETLEVDGFPVSIINRTSTLIAQWLGSPLSIAPCQVLNMSLLPGGLRALSNTFPDGSTYFDFAITNNGTFDALPLSFLSGLGTSILTASSSGTICNDPLVVLNPYPCNSLPPETIISLATGCGGVPIANGGTTLSNSITIIFIGTDDITPPSALIFECSIDGAEFSACTSPATYTGLTSGMHSFQVRAIDASSNVDPTPAVITWTVLTPQYAIEDLINQVRNLVDLGILNSGQGNSLISKLEAAINQLDKGNPIAAIGELYAFINHVGAFMKGGNPILTIVQGQPLIDAAQAIIDAINCGAFTLKKANESFNAKEVKDREISAEYSLLDAYPNPFNPITIISYQLPVTSYVSLKVFDLLGREVATLVSEKMPAGNHTRQWNATGLPSGVYFYQLQADSYTETKKLLLLR